MTTEDALTPHQRAILELPLETLVKEILLGFDIETIYLTPGGGYGITIPKDYQPSEEP